MRDDISDLEGLDHRPAFVAQGIQEMGLEPVAHISSGLKGWKEIEGPIEANN